MGAISQRDEDEPKRILPPLLPIQDPLDKFKRLVDVGKLMELVESLQLKREFIQFLHDQLIKYYDKEPHKRSFLALLVKTERPETTEELDDRFGRAIYMLHHLYCRESRADALFRICFATFQKRRLRFIMENIDNRYAFKNVLDQLIYFDKDPLVVTNAYREMRVFSFIHELIYDIKYDLKYKKFTRKSFEKKLNLIYELLLGEFQYEKFYIPTCSPFLYNRNEFVHYFCLHIDKEVDSMLSTMKILQKDIDASKLSEFERCVGPVVHMDIEAVRSSPIPLYIDAEINNDQEYDLPHSSSFSDSQSSFEIDFKTDSQNSDISSIHSDSDCDSHLDSHLVNDTDKIDSITFSNLASDFDENSGLDFDSC